MTHTILSIHEPFRHPSRTARGMQIFGIIVYGLTPEHCQGYVWHRELANSSQTVRTPSQRAGYFTQHRSRFDDFAQHDGSAGARDAGKIPGQAVQGAVGKDSEGDSLFSVHW